MKCSAIGAAFGPRKALHLRSELHVAGHRLPGQERVALEDHPGARLDAGDRPAPEIDHALGRREEARHQVQERRLAATRAADEADELSFGHLEAQVLQGDHLVPAASLEDLGHLISDDDARSHASGVPAPLVALPRKDPVFDDAERRVDHEHR